MHDLDAVKGSTLRREGRRIEEENSNALLGGGSIVSSFSTEWPTQN